MHTRVLETGKYPVPGGTFRLAMLTVLMVAALSTKIVSAAGKDSQDEAPAGTPCFMKSKQRVMIPGDVVSGATLVDLYDDGNWRALSDRAAQLVAMVAVKLGGGQSDADSSLASALQDWIIVIALKKEKAGSRMVQFLWSAKDLNGDPFPRVLPGVRRVCEVVIGEAGDSGEFSSRYSAAPKPSQIETDAVAVFEKLGKAIAPSSNFMKPQVTSSKPIEVRVSEVEIRDRRSTIQAHYQWIPPAEPPPVGKGDAKSPDPIKADVKWGNGPPEHWSFGVLAARTAGHASGSQRVKVADNRYALDPVDGPLTMLVVKLHLIGTNIRAKRMEPLKPLFIFAGATATPELGVGAGVGATLVRNAAIVAGRTGLRISRRPAELHLGDPVRGGDPFERGWSQAWFIGVSWGFD